MEFSKIKIRGINMPPSYIKHQKAEHVAQLLKNNLGLELKSVNLGIQNKSANKPLRYCDVVILGVPRKK